MGARPLIPGRPARPAKYNYKLQAAAAPAPPSRPGGLQAAPQGPAPAAAGAGGAAALRPGRLLRTTAPGGARTRHLLSPGPGLGKACSAGEEGHQREKSGKQDPRT